MDVHMNVSMAECKYGGLARGLLRVRAFLIWG